MTHLLRKLDQKDGSCEPCCDGRYALDNENLQTRVSNIDDLRLGDTYPTPALRVQTLSDTDQGQCISKDWPETGGQEGSHVEDRDSSSRLKFAIPRSNDEDCAGK